MEELRSRPYNALSYGTWQWQYNDGILYTITDAADFAHTKDIELTVNWNNPGQTEPGRIKLWSSVASCIHP
jgi:hypothetical protein